MPKKEIVIDQRYNGPPDSGNGGYTAGLLAKELHGPVKVLLRRPPPLMTTLLVEHTDGAAVLKHQEQLVASAQHATLELDVPACPVANQITAASSSYVNAEEHILPTCFVCGPAREPGDGLNIFPVVIESADCVAAFWSPVENLLDADGLVAIEVVWAALDCPGYFAHLTANKMMLLGSMTAHIKRRPAADEPLVVMGWPIGVDGRKYFSGTALYDQRGDLCAYSHQIWIALGSDQ